MNSEGDPTKLYASPRVDPTGQWLCWVQWALPDMPWDSSELWVGCLAPDGKSLLSSRRVAGAHPIIPNAQCYSNHIKLFHLM